MASSQTYTFTTSGGGASQALSIGGSSYEEARARAESIAKGNNQTLKGEPKKVINVGQPTRDVSVVSTSQGRNAVDQYTVGQDKDMQRMNDFYTKEDQKNQTPTQPTTNKGLTYEEAKALGIDLNSAIYDDVTHTYTPNDSGISYEKQKFFKETQSDLDNLDKIFKKQEKFIDTASNSVVRSLRDIYATRARQQQEANQRQLESYKTMELRGGGARYAGEVSQGIINAEERAGLQRLDEIAVEEANAVAKAEEARADKKWTLFVEKRKEVADLKKERQTQLDKLIDEDKKRKESAEQSTRDNAVAGLIEQGIDDPVKMLNFLNYNEQGQRVGDFTAKEVNESIKNLVPQGTGIIGEYQFYRRQALAAGQVPMDFIAYQNDDANRKRPITQIISDGGYTSAQGKFITSLNDKISKNGTYSKTSNMQSYRDNVLVALDQNNGTGDITAINQFQKVIDEGAVTRDQDVKLIQGAQSLADSLQLKVDKLKKGDQLSPEQRQQIRTITEQMYVKQVEALQKDPYIKSKIKEAELNGVDINDTILSELNGINTGTSIIQEESDAESKVITIAESKPELQSKVINWVKQGLSYKEILETYPEFFKE